MVKRAKSRGTDAVKVDGRVYHTEHPPSEQEDVMAVTKKLRSMKKGFEEVITREELRHFAIIYPRLYLVPKTTRERLEAWRTRKWAEISSWNVGEFFRTREDDVRAGVVPRKPGVPDEAREALQQRREEEAQERARKRARRRAAAQAQPQAEQHQQVDATVSSSTIVGDYAPDPAPSLTPTPAPAPAPAPASAPAPNENRRRHRQPGPAGANHPAPPARDLGAALGSIRRVAAHLKQLSDGADERDHYKKPLRQLAAELFDQLDRAQQAAAARGPGGPGGPGGRPRKRARRDVGGISDELDMAGEDEDEEDEDGYEEGDEEEEVEDDYDNRVNAKRAQTVAALALDELERREG